MINAETANAEIGSGQPHGAVEPSLRARGPAYSVMQQCLSIQSMAKPRGLFARLIGRSPLHPDARSWYRGALGEIEVAKNLASLGPEWTVLHSVPVGTGSADIDHVVIGPAGVFTINTKNHAGRRVWVGGSTMMVDGQRTDYIRNARFEAKRVSLRLAAVAHASVWVTPIIALIAPSSLTSGAKDSRVVVLRAEHLAKWLTSRPPVHADEVVAYFSSIAEVRATWHDRPVLLDDTLRHETRFERLRHEVDVARRRRIAWRTGLGVAAIVFINVVAVVIPLSLLTN